MKIIFEKEYKSLTSFESDNLQDFTIITGKNGAGKSQLVELIRDAVKHSLRFEPAITDIAVERFHDNSDLKLQREKWRKNLESVVINPYIEKNEELRKLIKRIIDNGLWMPNLSDEKYRNFLGSEEINRLSKSGNSLATRTDFIKINYKMGVAANFVADFFGKEFHALLRQDFLLAPIPEELLYDVNSQSLDSQIGLVFYNYAQRRDQNARLYFDKKEYATLNDAVSDIDFLSKYPPPWETINAILETYNVDFEFTGIERTEFSQDMVTIFSLIKKTTKKEIPLKDLSSGEKVIIGLIVKLFTSQYYTDNLGLPELIVLDEPDAFLHPEMSQLLIDVLVGTFVEKLNIKVIMITHSPSTIALCPDDSIYQLFNVPETSLIKTSKKEALKLLTGFIPTLSIDYENHKQVFVESPTDVKYYQTIFNKLYEDNQYPYRLYFISNSMGKGNCDQVINIVNDIRLTGNETSFGIIDRDSKNKNGKFIKVHGQR